MNYTQDMELLRDISSSLDQLHGLEEYKEALNDAISALKTLEDMGDTMNRFLREEHKS